MTERLIIHLYILYSHVKLVIKCTWKDVGSKFKMNETKPIFKKMSYRLQLQ